jgi:hypothetical protein
MTPPLIAVGILLIQVCLTWIATREHCRRK